MHISFFRKNGFSDFLADVVARYNLYVARENKKLQLQRAAQEAALVMQSMQPDYYNTGDILMDAIGNTSSITHIVSVHNRSCIFSDNPINQHKRGFYVMTYRALRTPSDVTEADVRRILQNEMNQLCNYYGYPRKVIGIRYQSDHRVLIHVANADDVVARKPVQI